MDFLLILKLILITLTDNMSRTGENFQRWRNTVEEWKAIYGTSNSSSINTDFNISSIVVVKRCKKCGKIRKRVSRHHKGHEYLFACLLPDKYASRYILFHPDDVVWLCDKCHTRVHVVYQSIIKKLWRYIDNRYKCDQPIQPMVIESFRIRIVKACNVWLDFKPPKKKKRKRRRNYDPTSRQQRSYRTYVRS